jgi:hypothetical protein
MFVFVVRVDLSAHILLQDSLIICVDFAVSIIEIELLQELLGDSLKQQVPRHVKVVVFYG